MGNGKNLKRFSLDAKHFHPRRTHRHPLNRQTSDVGPFPQKALKSSEPTTQALTKPCRAEACQRATERDAFMNSSTKRTESVSGLSLLALTLRQMLLCNVIELAEEP